MEVLASPLLSVPRPLGEDRETNQVFPESVENLKKVFSECPGGNKQAMPGNTSGDKVPSRHASTCSLISVVVNHQTVK